MNNIRSNPPSRVDGTMRPVTTIRDDKKRELRDSGQLNRNTLAVIGAAAAGLVVTGALLSACADKNTTTVTAGAELNVSQEAKTDAFDMIKNRLVNTVVLEPGVTLRATPKFINDNTQSVTQSNVVVDGTKTKLTIVQPYTLQDKSGDQWIAFYQPGTSNPTNQTEAANGLVYADYTQLDGMHQQKASIINVYDPYDLYSLPVGFDAQGMPVGESGPSQLSIPVAK